jgi:hypothetical protein
MYISARPTSLWRFTPYFYAPKATATTPPSAETSQNLATISGSWYQFPPYNSVRFSSYLDADYLVEPIFCAGQCASLAYITVIAPG